VRSSPYDERRVDVGPSQRTCHGTDIVQQQTDRDELALLSLLARAGTSGVIAIAALAGPIGAFLAGAAFFTVREERRNFRERHQRGRD
jgi:hypothetical protein